MMNYREMALLGLTVCFVACAPTKKFCPQDQVLDFAEALRFAQKARLAYLSPDSAAREACAADSCFFFTGTRTKATAFLQIDDSAKVQWLSFRGTQTLSDIKLNGDYTQTQDTVLSIYFHRGFAAGVTDLYPDVRAHLRKDFPVHIAGHSLGGAMAVVAGLRLRREGFKVKTQTFGQPKVTNGAGAKQADSLELVRWINGKDLVALVPPVDWKPGRNLGDYRHFGREVVLLDKPPYECLVEHYSKRYDPTSWWEQVSEQAIQDHLLDRYIARLKQLSDASTVPTR